MSQYLIFQLHGPMASWGVDAPGEVRHTHELPSRSALLGLLAAGVGIPSQVLNFRPGVKIDVFRWIWMGCVWFLFFLLIINKLSVL